MVAVPMMKLFSLTVKTLAKPVAKRIKFEGERHPTVRGVLISMGQATNNLSARVSIRMAGHTTTKIKPLEEDKAVRAGGDLLAEGFVYSLGTSLMVWEYLSSAREKEAKEAVSKTKKKSEQQQLAAAFEAINHRLAELEAIAARQEAEREAGLRRTDTPGRLIQSHGGGGDGDGPDAVAPVSTGTGTGQWRLSLGMLLPWRRGRSVPTVGENAEGFESSRDLSPPGGGGGREKPEGFESSRDVAPPGDGGGGGSSGKEGEGEGRGSL